MDTHERLCRLAKWVIFCREENALLVFETFKHGTTLKKKKQKQNLLPEETNVFRVLHRKVNISMSYLFPLETYLFPLKFKEIKRIYKMKRGSSETNLYHSLG